MIYNLIEKQLNISTFKFLKELSFNHLTTIIFLCFSFCINVQEFINRKSNLKSESGFKFVRINPTDEIREESEG
jgi:hypothetical protein